MYDVLLWSRVTEPVIIELGNVARAVPQTWVRDMDTASAVFSSNESFVAVNKGGSNWRFSVYSKKWDHCTIEGHACDDASILQLACGYLSVPDAVRPYPSLLGDYDDEESRVQEVITKLAKKYEWEESSDGFEFDYFQLEFTCNRGFLWDVIISVDNRELRLRFLRAHYITRFIEKMFNEPYFLDV